MSDAEGHPIDTDVELARLAAIVASSSDAIVSKDLNGIINSWNYAAECIFGYAPHEIIGRPITTIIPEDLQSEEDLIIGKIRRGERVEPFDTLRRTKDGRLIDVSITVSPVRNSKGVIVGASKIARDVTERKRTEQLQATLVNELNHRTKNLLVTVQAIAVQTFGDSIDQQDAVERFRRRVGALAISQDLLIKNGWRGAPLTEMLNGVLGPFGNGANIKLQPGPKLHLNLRQTNALAMAVHELATNAAKHGALSSSDGFVEVSWVQSGDAVVLRWAEKNGPTITKPNRTGFGTVVIKQALQHELEANVDLDYRANGLACVIRFPVDAGGSVTQ